MPEPRTEAARSLRRMVDRWIDGGMTADQYLDFQTAVADIEAEAAGEVRPENAEKHEPGDHHRYRMECEVCGERGTVRLTLDPERTPSETPA